MPETTQKAGEAPVDGAADAGAVMDLTLGVVRAQILHGGYWGLELTAV